MGRQAISATGMVMMAFASPLVALRFSSIYWIIPPLMIFGLSSPVTLTPVLPEMGETVSEMVNIKNEHQIDYVLSFLFTYF